MTLKIFDQIASWTTGPDVILAMAERRLVASMTEHHLTARPLDRKFVVETIVASIQAHIAYPLEEAMAAEINSVTDVYELTEGPPPDDDCDLLLWSAGCEARMMEALQGDTIELLSKDEVERWVKSNDDYEILSKSLLLALCVKPARLFEQAGITVADIEALAKKLGAASSSNPGGDHVDETSRSADIDAPPSKLPMTSAEAEAFHTGKRQRSPTVLKSAYTDAARALLEVLIAKTRITDQDVADAVGVSRPQAYNYRMGKTKWSPTPVQRKAMENLIYNLTEALTGAWGAIERESQQVE